MECRHETLGCARWLLASDDHGGTFNSHLARRSWGEDNRIQVLDNLERNGLALSRCTDSSPVSSLATAILQHLSGAFWTSSLPEAVESVCRASHRPLCVSVATVDSNSASTSRPMRRPAKWSCGKILKRNYSATWLVARWPLKISATTYDL